MQTNNHLHRIAPEKVIRGENAWDEGKVIISSLYKKPILLGRSSTTLKVRDNMANDISEVVQRKFNYCVIDELINIKKLSNTCSNRI